MTTKPLTRKVPKNPKEAALMAHECLGLSDEVVTGEQLHELAAARGWDITPDFAAKVVKWHCDYLKTKARAS